MQVKVFEAETMAAALKKVKEALGPDALILSTRTLRKSGIGLLSKPLIEVTAAIESNDAQPQQAVKAYASQQTADKTAQRRDPSEAAQISYKQLWKQKKVIDPLEAEVKDLREMVANQDLQSLRGELDELKSVIRELGQQNTQPIAPPPQETQQPVAAGRPDQALDLLMASLKGHDLDQTTAETLARYAGSSLHPQQLGNPALLDQFFLDTIGDLLHFAPPLFSHEGQKRVALVGPTGVGKTTTIAKLAAEYLKNNSGRVALFTIDTYRIAAVEQLKVYGEIMNLPVEVIYSPEQLQTSFDQHQDKDLILIDTSGRSHRDDQGMAELEAFLGTESGTENHLVLATGTRGQDLTDIVTSFRRIPLASLIFSKIDECRQRGALLDVPLRQNLPISYLTNGQRVPEDLLIAKPKLVAECILGKQ